ncbi:DNA adenine methylase [Serratia symbiotica]|uniref:DNA adenine methylase n=1 Tax=Serratia symbiotica TaxID=138074 RepID=UPI00209177B5|nr:DNA adenine methylase [Serratia symbiotica]USS95575.1 DNA adenine methylase [Serratia symbiotica]
MSNPIVPWVGGKRRLAKHLLPLYPYFLSISATLSHFAAVQHFFFKKNASKVEVINDVSGELINLYRVVKNHLEEFVRQFK